MRTLGRVVAVVAAVGVLGWVATVVVLGGTSGWCDEYALNANAAFTGAVVERQGDVVTFVVESAALVAPDIPLAVAPGERVIVVYPDDDARFLHVGERYRVVTATRAADQWQSNVMGANECSHGIRTAHADGSPIDTGLLTRDGIRPYVGRIAVTTIALLAASVIAVMLWRRHQRPRLTIDGRPLP